MDEMNKVETENTEVEETCTDMATVDLEPEKESNDNHGLAIAVMAGVGTLAVVGATTLVTKAIIPGAKKAAGWIKNVKESAKAKKDKPVCDAESKDVSEEKPAEEPNKDSDKK